MEMWAKSQNTKKITVPVKKQPVTVLKQTPAIFTPTTSNSPIESAQQEPEEAVQLEKESSNEPESPKDQDNLKVLILVPHITVLIRRFLKQNAAPRWLMPYIKYLNNLICLS